MEGQIIPESITVVSFDLWKTLVVGNPQFTAEWNEELRTTLASSLDLDVFNKVAHEQDARADVVCEKQGCNVSFEERVQYIADNTQGKTLSADELTALYGRLIQILQQHPPVLIDPDAAPTLQRLGERYHLVVSSNSGFLKSAELRWTLERVKLLEHFNALVFSDDIGYTKPDIRFFQAISAAADIKPEYIAHVGDSIENDFEGAKRAGMHAIRYLSGAPLSDVLGI
jgi:putative hydrolase of the HAD superfamily